jgi:hypothetical protein
MAASWLPNEDEQRLCQECMTRFPVEGPGLCYLFGAYRAQGLTREQAAAKVRASLEQETPPPGEPPEEPRACLFGALRLWSVLWLVICLSAPMVIAVAGYWRWNLLCPLVWLLGQRGLVGLTCRDPYWDDRLLGYLFTKGGQ